MVGKYSMSVKIGDRVIIAGTNFCQVNHAPTSINSSSIKI